ncbi:MAG: endonuclease [Ferruginibacter sp.]
MIKKITISVLLSFSFLITLAQIPAGYYNTTSGLACQPLKTALSNIITTGQVSLIYGQLDDIQMPVVDTIRSDDGATSIIWDIYSNNNSGPEPFVFNSTQIAAGGFCGASSAATEGFCWNKEHTFPRAWFQNMDGTYPSPTNADLFNVRPTDYKINSVRANNPYSTITSPSYIFPTIGAFPGYPIPPNPILDKLGPSSASGVVIPIAFEPPNGVKGDLARGYFYMLTRYESQLASWILLHTGNGIEKVVDGANAVYPSFQLPYLTMMYNWHIADPVDAREINRNNLIYTQQNNRNPYVDHPEYVALVWQCTGVIPVTLTSFTAEKRSGSILLRWNATYESSFKQFDIERSVDGTNFYKVAQVDGGNLASYSFEDHDYPNQSILYYRLKMIDIDVRFKNSNIIAVRLNDHFSNAVVYPNPTKDRLSIKLTEPLALNTVLVVTDLVGRIVKQETVNNGTLIILTDVSQLVSGRYFIKLVNESRLINQSFIIMR